MYLGTESTAWGSPTAAAARAKLEVVSNHNEEMIRSYHPALSMVDRVWVLVEPYALYNKIWVVEDLRAGTEAGGRVIHIAPTDEIVPRTWIPTEIPDARLRPLNPRGILELRDIEGIRALYPSSVGVELFTSGHMVLLYRTKQDIEESWQDFGHGHTWGTVPLLYGLLEYAFVQCNTIKDTRKNTVRQLARRARDWAIDKLSIRRLPKLATLQTLSSKGSTLIGMPVDVVYTDNKVCIVEKGWTVVQTVGLTPDLQIGTITKTFKPVPLATDIPLPGGYLRDLWLLTGEDLPPLAKPLDSPLITGWGSPERLLAGEPCFGAGQNSTTRKAKLATGIGLPAPARRAVVEGMHYSWDRAAPFATAIMWRTDHDLE